LSDLPPSWIEAPLPLVCEKITDGTHHSPVNLPVGDFKYVTAKNIRPWGLDLSDISFVDEKTHREIYARCPVEKGDVLYIKDGATTGLAVVNPLDEPFSMLSSVALIKPDRDILDPGYLRYWLNSPSTLSAMLGQMTGTAIRRLTLTTISSQTIPLPPLAEQGRIAALVDSLSARTSRARIELSRLPILIARYKQRLLSLAYSGELTASWRAAQLVAAPRPALLSDTVAVPVRNGLSVRGSDQPPGVRALRLSALRGSEVNMDDVRFLPIDADRAARFVLQEDDILISRGNGTRSLVGIGSRVPAVVEQTIFPDTAFRIRLNKERVDPRWFVSIWNSPQVRVQIEKRARTTAGIWKVAQSDLAQIELLLPTPAEQTEITRRIEAAFGWLDRVAADHSGASRLLAKLDAAILAKAFRGELVPQDPNDEPASALLERAQHEPRKPLGRTRRTKAINSKDSLMAETRLQPSERLLRDSENWPTSGLSVSEVMSRNASPHDDLRDALFDLLSGPTPRLRQEFDPVTETMMIKRVAA